MFPEELAKKIGLDLSSAPQGSGAGVGLGNVPLRYATVSLRISNAKEHHEWQTWVAFTPARLRYPLLAFAGFLQYFDATFLGGFEIVELATNGLYPRT